MEEIRQRQLECRARTRSSNNDSRPASITLALPDTVPRVKLDAGAASSERARPSFQRDRRAFDDEPRAQRLCREEAAGAGDHLAHVVPGRHHDEYDVASRELGKRRRDFRAVLRQRLGFGASAIPYGQIGALFREPRRHRVAHASDADPADACVRRHRESVQAVSMPNGMSIANSQCPAGCRRATSTALPVIVVGLPSGPVILSVHRLASKAMSPVCATSFPEVLIVGGGEESASASRIAAAPTTTLPGRHQCGLRLVQRHQGIDVAGIERLFEQAVGPTGLPLTIMLLLSMGWRSAALRPDTAK